jgi:hypothetical protein
LAETKNKASCNHLLTPLITICCDKLALIYLGPINSLSRFEPKLAFIGTKHVLKISLLKKKIGHLVFTAMLHSLLVNENTSNSIKLLDWYFTGFPVSLPPIRKSKLPG